MGQMGAVEKILVLRPAPGVDQRRTPFSAQVLQVLIGLISPLRTISRHGIVRHHHESHGDFLSSAYPEQFIQSTLGGVAHTELVAEGPESGACGVQARGSSPVTIVSECGQLKPAPVVKSPSLLVIALRAA